LHPNSRANDALECASFALIAEASTAVPYFWLLLFSVLFGPLGRRGRIVVAAMAVPALLLHEATVFLGPLLAAAALVRARGEEGAPARFLYLLCAWFGLAALVAADFVRACSHRRASAMGEVSQWGSSAA